MLFFTLNKSESLFLYVNYKIKKKLALILVFSYIKATK